MINTLVSIIMPAYNAEKFITESIESIVRQTYENWELIIVDDGSSDNTKSIVEQYLENEPRIKYFYQSNAKQGKARNKGIENSEGYYIAFLDADDLWLPDKLEIQFEEMYSNQGLDLLFSQGYKIINNTIEVYNVVVKQVWDKCDLPIFIHCNQIPILSVLVKKEVLISVGCFTDNPYIQNAEDYHLWLKLLIKNFKFRSTQSRLFQYRIHEGQNTFQNLKIGLPIFSTYEDIYLISEDKNVRKIILDKIKWYIFNDEYFARCLNLIIVHFRNRNKKFISHMIKYFFNSNNPVSQRVLFHLIKIYG